MKNGKYIQENRWNMLLLQKKISHSDYVSIDSQQDLQLFIINHNEFITETKIANVSVMSW